MELYALKAALPRQTAYPALRSNLGPRGYPGVVSVPNGGQWPAPQPRKKQKPRGCELCQRAKPLTFHHLIPKKNHRKSYFKRRFAKSDMTTRGAWLCHACHRHLHRSFGERELGLYLNTLEALKQTPEVKSFLYWVKKQR